MTFSAVVLFWTIACFAGKMANSTIEKTILIITSLTQTFIWKITRNGSSKRGRTCDAIFLKKKYLKMKK
jgi:hypothetical protein